MKRSKLLALIETVQERDRALSSGSVTFDTLEIDFEARRVTFRGHTINVDQPAISFPILSTDRLVLTKRGEDVL